MVYWKEAVLDAVGEKFEQKSEDTHDLRTAFGPRIGRMSLD